MDLGGRALLCVSQAVLNGEEGVCLVRAAPVRSRTEGLESLDILVHGNAALEEGATFVRVGTALFGARPFAV